MDDEALITAYRQGDESALNEIIKRYTPRLYRFAFRLTSDPELASDCVQEAFVKAWKGLDRFDESSYAFRPWMFTIARNVTIDLMRKRRDISFTAAGDDDDSFADSVSDDGLLPDAEAIASETAEALEGAIQSLSLDRRAVVIMHAVEGLTFEEIAIVAGKPMNTVKSQYRRALAAMKSHLAGRGFE